MFWILTPDARRGYGITYSTPRDKELLAEIDRASQMFASLQTAELPAYLRDSDRHLIPRQFAWSRAESDAATLPQITVRDDKTVLYQFKPQMASAERFEKTGEGVGYIWGFGSGYLEYTIPERGGSPASQRDCRRARISSRCCPWMHLLVSSKRG